MHETTNRVIAILAGDLHLQQTPPPCRAREPDWYAAMARPLDEIASLSLHHGVAVVWDGDIFDRWNPPNELVNFALTRIRGAAVPGQHDLPNHRIEDIRKSGFWTLVEAGRLEYLIPGRSYGLAPGWGLVGFAWSVPLSVEDLDFSFTDIKYLAAVHSYCWMRGHTYPGADPGGHAAAVLKRLGPFTAVACGDNHQGFLYNADGRYLMNTGTVMRRTSKEVNYKPHVGLLYEDGTIKPHYLDISEDVFDVVEHDTLTTETAHLLNMPEFMAALTEMAAGDLDFVETVRALLRGPGVTPEAAALICEVLGI